MTRIALVLAGMALSADPAPVTVSGKVLGASGKHPVLVALWDAGGFLQKPLQTRRFEPKDQPSFQFEVAPGRYALSAFEDVNGNGVLDMGLFGPKEPSGFFKVFTAWRKPTFADVSWTADKAVQGADIPLK